MFRLAKIDLRPVYWCLVALACAATAPWLVEFGKVTLIAAAFLAAAATYLVFTLPSGFLPLVYFVYLLFEGGLKILSNYHPVLHVGSDVLLVFIFFRLLNRWLREKDQWKETITCLPSLHRIAGFIALFWVWVGIQFFNPWSIGILPAIAGFKLYVVPMLMFFIVAFLLKEEELRRIPYLILALACFESLVAIIDWLLGPSFVTSLHPRYGSVIINYLNGTPYRPFGTTQLPGSPSVWISQSVPSALIATHFLLTDKEPQDRRWRSFWWTLIALYIPLSLITIIICQVRAMALRYAVVGTLGLIIAGGKRTTFSVLTLLCVAVLPLWDTSKPTKEDRSQYESVTDRMNQALSRIQTLASVDTYVQARGGAWAIHEAFARMQHTMLGIGLSRISASAQPWIDRIKSHRYFRDGWDFVDNLYLALLTELGVGGLLAYLLLVGAIFLSLIQKRSYYPRLGALYLLVALALGYASEGLLYQPDASLFWLYVGLTLRLDTSGVA